MILFHWKCISNLGSLPLFHLVLNLIRCFLSLSISSIFSDSVFIFRSLMWKSFSKHLPSIQVNAFVCSKLLSSFLSMHFSHFLYLSTSLNAYSNDMYWWLRWEVERSSFFAIGFSIFVKFTIAQTHIFATEYFSMLCVLFHLTIFTFPDNMN